MIKKKKKYEQSVVVFADWTVSLVSDEDGHLSVYVCQGDKTKIITCEADIRNEYEWKKRFTTEKIEKDYKGMQVEFQTKHFTLQL